MKRRVRFLSVLVALLMLAGMLAGCGSSGQPEKESTAAQSSTVQQTEVKDLAFYEMYDKVSDSSELPDWTGKQLDLKVWYAHGTGDASRKTSEKDVVRPEIQRVTGVSVNKDTSFDNGGQTAYVKLGMLAAANDWPDMCVTTDMSSFKDIIAAGKVYDLTDAIKKYAPNLPNKLPLDKLPMVQKQISNNFQDGEKYYAFPAQLDGQTGNLVIHPEFDMSKVSAQNGLNGNTKIWIRDDILKMLYPNAKSENEIEELYQKNGTFTKDELYDIPIKSRDDFVKLLYDIKNLIDTKGIKENGKPLEVTYAANGKDNWDLLAMFMPMINGIPCNNNYYTYYDKKTGKVEYMFKQDFFKDNVTLFNKLVRDGIMDKNSFLENNAAHLEKLNSGQYAVAYIYDTPDEALLQKAGKTFRYRALWLDMPFQNDKFIPQGSPTGCNYEIMLFKDKVKEEDVPQIVRYLDYLISDIGAKMYTWGPRSAGLFTEDGNGNRKFMDKDLEDTMVYGADNGKSMYYNLFNPWVASGGSYGNAWPYYVADMWGGGIVGPRYTYTKERTAATGKDYFNPGNLPDSSYLKLRVPVTQDYKMWGFSGAVPEVKRFFDAKAAFEKALTKVLAAQSDAQFNDLWKQFMDLAVANGATDETLDAINSEWTKNGGGIIK